VSSIAFVVPEMLPVPPTRGGAVEHWVHEASARMVSRSHRIAMVSRPAGVAGIAGVQYIGIPWTRSEQACHWLKERTSHKNPLRHLAKIQNVWSYGRRAAQAVRGFDITYLHNEPNVLLFLRRQAGERIVLHMHNDHLSLRAFRSLYGRALSKADAVICVSDFIRRRAIAQFPEHAGRFKVVENGTDASTFRPYGEEAWRQLSGALTLDRSRQYVLYVGRLTPIKGVHVLIEAFREVFRRNPRARLLIVGSSFFEGAAKTPYERQLVELAAPISDAIVFTGYLPHSTLKYLYSACDVSVVPSVWDEPSGLVVLEAMASGTCVVASKVGGIPELIDPERTGVLVAPSDPRALSSAVSGLLDNAERRRSMEIAAREAVVKRYSWERVVSEVESVFGALQ
jgi:spore coat protein SA